IASAVCDCRPSTGKAAAIELSVIARIPGKGGFDSGRYGTLRTPRTPENAIQPRPADTRQVSFWRTGAVRESPRQGVGHDAHGFDAAVGGAAGHGRNLVGAAFLDGNLGHAVGDGEIDGRRR